MQRVGNLDFLGGHLVEVGVFNGFLLGGLGLLSGTADRLLGSFSSSRWGKGVNLRSILSLLGARAGHRTTLLWGGGVGVDIVVVRSSLDGLLGGDLALRGSTLNSGSDSSVGTIGVGSGALLLLKLLDMLPVE